jgi:nicotinamide mononucleotide transporter
MGLFSVENIAFEVFGYPLSWIELVGTVLYLWSVWLISRRNMLTWPVGIISVLLYMVLFYQIRLYADAIEQIYYLGASVYGWWLWRKSIETQKVEDDTGQPVFYSSMQTILMVAAGTLVLSGLTGLLISRAHLIIPAFFPEPAAVPYLDALTTIMSFSAMLMMAQKRTESWIYWIIVDVIGIGLYYARDVRFISLLYVILLVIAINGFITWNRNSTRGQPEAVASYAG